MTTTTNQTGTAIHKVTLTPELIAAAEEIMAAAKAEPEPEPITDPYHVSAEFVEIPSAQAKTLLKKWHDAKAEYEKAKEAMEAAKQAILERMDFAEVLVAEETGQYLCESRVSTAMVLDSAKLKKAHPEIVNDFQRERRSRSFRVLV